MVTASFWMGTASLGYYFLKSWTRHWKDQGFVLAMMIEVRRDLYIDEAIAQKLPEFEAVGDKIRDVVAQVINVAEDTADISSWCHC